MEAKKLEGESEALQVACISPSKEWKPTMTEAEHEAVLEAKAQQAAALETVSKADRPIPTVLEEGFTFVRVARAVSPELEAVGLRHGLIDEYEGFLFALMSAHVLVAGVRANRRTEAEKRSVAEGRAVFADVGAAARLALRGTDAAERVAVILAEKEEATLVPNMNELAKTVAREEAAFAAKHVDARKQAAALVEAAELVRVALSEEETARRLAEGHDLRDRFYTLAMQCLDEIRAHAEYAFRNEPGGKRQLLFSSEYTRARGRKYQSKKKAGADLRVAGAVGDEGTEK